MPRLRWNLKEDFTIGQSRDSITVYFSCDQCGAEGQATVRPSIMEAGLSAGVHEEMASGQKQAMTGGLFGLGLLKPPRRKEE